jgi:hypothetical protein
MGNTTNSMIDVDDYIDLCIKNIIDSEQTKAYFSCEWEFQRKFAKELMNLNTLKEKYPSNVMHSIVEYPELNFYPYENGNRKKMNINILLMLC